MLVTQKLPTEELTSLTIAPVIYKVYERLGLCLKHCNARPEERFDCNSVQ